MQDIPVSSTRFLRDFCFEIFAFRFSAALGNMSQLYCTRLHENSRHIVLASSNRALRTRLSKSYAFVLPSRHLAPIPQTDIQY